jgi:TonB family protein
MTRDKDMGMEIGLLAGLLFLNVLFQFLPATELGRLSNRTFDNSMEAVDALLPYDETVDEKQAEVDTEKNLIDERLDVEIEAITPELVISLSTDTVGLSTATTIETGLPSGNETNPELIGPPGFIPVEVFPVCTFMPPPGYPEMARMAGVEGIVTLWVYIDAQGIVREVELMQTSGVTSLDDAAISAAMNTGWNSARNNGLPVGVWTTLRYNFSLSD